MRIPGNLLNLIFILFFPLPFSPLMPHSPQQRIPKNLWRYKSACRKKSEGFGEAVCSVEGRIKCGCGFERLEEVVQVVLKRKRPERELL